MGHDPLTHVAVSEGWAVNVQGQKPLAVALILHAVEAELVAHVGGLPGAQRPPGQLGEAPVFLGDLLGPVVASLGGDPGQDPHEAVAVLEQSPHVISVTRDPSPGDRE